MLEMICILTRVMITQVYTYVKIPQMIHLDLCVLRLYLKKKGKKTPGFFQIALSIYHLICLRIIRKHTFVTFTS